MYRYRFYDLKVHFWWPNKRLFSYNQRWNTLYNFAFEKSPDYLSLKHWSSLAIQRERYGSMIFEFGRLRVQHNNIFFLHTKKWSKKWTRLPKLFVVLIWYQKSTLELQIYLSVTAECVRALKAFFWVTLNPLTACHLCMCSRSTIKLSKRVAAMHNKFKYFWRRINIFLPEVSSFFGSN